MLLFRYNSNVNNWSYSSHLTWFEIISMLGRTHVGICSNSLFSLLRFAIASHPLDIIKFVWIISNMHKRFFHFAMQHSSFMPSKATDNEHCGESNIHIYRHFSGWNPWTAWHRQTYYYSWHLVPMIHLKDAICWELEPIHWPIESCCLQCTHELFKQLWSLLGAIWSISFLDNMASCQECSLWSMLFLGKILLVMHSLCCKILYIHQLIS